MNFSLGDVFCGSADVGGKPDACGKIICASAGNIAKGLVCAAKIAGNDLIKCAVLHFPWRSTFSFAGGC